MGKFNTKEEKVNTLVSEIRNFISEAEPEDTEMFLAYLSDIMCVFDTDIAIEVLENFGEEGKEQAIGIKVRWGY
jgi:hypothetical protein